jgi:hypothetical protein
MLVSAILSARTCIQHISRHGQNRGANRCCRCSALSCQRASSGSVSRCPLYVCFEERSSLLHSRTHILESLALLAASSSSAPSLTLPSSPLTSLYHLSPLVCSAPASFMRARCARRKSWKKSWRSWASAKAVRCSRGSSGPHKGTAGRRWEGTFVILTNECAEL